MHPLSDLISNTVLWCGIYTRIKTLIYYRNSVWDFASKTGCRTTMTFWAEQTYPASKQEESEPDSAIFIKFWTNSNAPIKLWAYLYNSRSNNSKPLIPLQSRTTQCQNSFFYRFWTIPQWNSLPMEVVSLTSISSFKHSLIDNYLFI